MIPIEVDTAVLALQSYLGDPDMYYAGGCLQDRKAEDYDVLVIGCDMDDEDIMVEFNDLILVDTSSITTSYPDEIENPYFMIVVTEVAGVKVDFLFVKKDMDIFDALDRFPLSIQMKAIDVGDNNYIIHGSRYSADPIVVYIGGNAEIKYRKYYPFIKFSTPEGNTLLAIEDQPYPY